MEPYRESLHEGAELTHELREVPALHQGRPELEGDAEQSQHRVRERQGRDVVVGHCLHPPEENNLYIFTKLKVKVDTCLVVLSLKLMNKSRVLGKVSSLTSVYKFTLRHKPHT